MKKIKSEKKYECPFCQLGSSRKYNMEVHIKRKHSLQQQTEQQTKTEFFKPSSSTTSTTLYQSIEPLYDQTISQIDSGNALNESTSLQSFPSPFLEYSYFESLENQQKLERRANQRKFYQTINEFRNFFANFNTNIINIPISYYQLPFDNPSTQIPLNWLNNSDNSKNPMDSKLTIEASTKIPCAHKIYKCKRCSTEILLPIFDFDDIIEEEKFQHKCWNYSFISQYHNEKMMDHDLDHYYYSNNVQDLLLSIISSRINSQKIALKTVVLPEVIIQNPICFFILEIIKNVFELNLIPNKIFNLLKVEKFIDLGEINLDYWAYRAYNSPNEIFLGKEELRSIVKILHASFGLIVFEVNRSKKFMFCCIPLSEESITVG